jgi:hypothetical protein
MVPEKFGVLEHYAFWIFGLGMFNFCATFLFKLARLKLLSFEVNVDQTIFLFNQGKKKQDRAFKILI